MFEIANDRLFWLIALPFGGVLLTFAAALCVQTRRTLQVSLLGPVATLVAAAMTAADLQLIVPIKRSFAQSLAAWFGVTGTSAPLNIMFDPMIATFVIAFTLSTIVVLLTMLGRHEEQTSSNAVKINLLLSAVVLTLIAGNWLLFIAGWMLSGALVFALAPGDADDPTTNSRGLWLLSRLSDLGLIIVALVLVRLGSTFNFVDIAGAYSQHVEHVPKRAILWCTGLVVLASSIRAGLLPFGLLKLQTGQRLSLASGLGHAANLVTAIILVAKIAPLFATAGGNLTKLSVLGIASALYFGLTALFQSRLSRLSHAVVLAQTGLVFAVLGRGGFATAVSHGAIIAISATLFFLVVSSLQTQLDKALVGHGGAGEDLDLIETMGGLGSAMPRSFILFCLTAMLLLGAPPLSSFSTLSASIWESMASALRNINVSMLMFLTIAVTNFALMLATLRVFYGAYRGKPDARPDLVEADGRAFFGIAAGVMVMAIVGWFGGLGDAVGLSANLDQELGRSVFFKAKIISKTQVPLFGVWFTKLGFLGLVALVFVLTWTLAWAVYVMGLADKFSDLFVVQKLRQAFDKGFFVESLGEWLIVKPLFALALLVTAVAQWLSAHLIGTLGALPARWLSRSKNGSDTTTPATPTTPAEPSAEIAT